MELISKVKTVNPVRWVPSVYFAMGLPFVVLNMVSVLMFKNFGISDAQIAFWTSLVMLPWTLKPLWSPLPGMFKTKKFFVAGTQFLTGITFALIAISMQATEFFVIAVVLLGVIAFSGATHDIATDGLYMDELTQQQQARYIGWQGAFYNLAKVVATGALVYFAGFLTSRLGNVHAWMIVMGICSFIMLSLGAYHSLILPPGTSVSSDSYQFRTAMQELWEVVRSFFTKKNIALQILFIILYRLAEGFQVKIVPLFLKAPRYQQGLGLSEQEIGLYYGTFGVIAFIAGSVLAGYYISLRGLRKTLFTLCCVFNAPILIFYLLASFQPEQSWIIAGSLALEYFGYGFGFVGLTLFMMQQIAPGRYQMAHYAFATGIMNLGVMVPGMLSGVLSDWLGYKTFFLWVVIATIPAYLITALVPFTTSDSTSEKN